MALIVLIGTGAIGYAIAPTTDYNSETGYLSDFAEKCVSGQISASQECYKSALSYYSRLYGLDYGTELLIRDVITCESGWNSNAKNPDSTASGIAQYLDSTFKLYCKGEKDNPYNQLECMAQMVSKGMITHWECYYLI